MTASKKAQQYLADVRELDRILQSVERAVSAARNPPTIAAAMRQLHFGEHGIPFEQLDAADTLCRRLTRACDDHDTFEVRGDEVRIADLAQRLATVKASAAPFRKLRGLLVA